MEDANMLSQVYSTKICEGTTSSTSCSGTTDKSKSWTVWSNSDGFWRPRQEYAWQPDNSSDTSAPSSHTSGETELITTFNEYDGHGNLLKATDSRGTETSIVWGHEDTVPHAIADNADDSEVFTEGFGEGLSSNWYNSHPSVWQVKNGKLSYEGALTTWGWVGWKTALPSDFVAEYDIRVKWAASSSKWGGFQFRKNNASDTFAQSGYMVYITRSGNLVLYRGGSSAQTLANYAGVGSATLPRRFRVEAEGDNIRVYVDGVLRVDVTDNTFSGNYVGFTSFKSNTQFDNLRVYPLDASVTSASYDEETLAMNTLIDPSGAVTSFKYDPLGRLVQTINHDDDPLSNHTYYFSREGSTNDTFDPTKPNYVQSSVMQFDPFIPDWSIERTSNNDFTTMWTKSTVTTGTTSLDSTEAKVGVRSIKASLTGTGERVLWNIWPGGWSRPVGSGYPVDDSQLYHMGVWVKSSSNYSGGAYFWVFFQDANGTPVNNPQVRIDIPTCGCERDWTLFSETFELPVGVKEIYAVYLNWDGNAGSGTQTLWWDGAQFQQVPVTTRTYSDGLGRSIQTQQLTNDSTVVTATDYDDQGRPSKAWAPFLVDGLGDYDQNHSSSATAYFNEYSNLVHNNRPYVETEYEANPLQRPSIIHPVAISSNANSERISYGTELIGSDRYFYTESEDEDERKTRTHVDAFGNTVRSTVGVGTSNPAITQFFYDELDQLTKVIAPQGYNSSPETFNTFYHYDQRGRLTGKTTPDADGDGDGSPTDESATYAGDYQYKYDVTGNLRFAQDPNLRASSGDYLYYKYDDLNRLIESGIYTGSTSFGSANPDNDTWPTSSITKKTAYTYEGNFLTRVDTWEGGVNDYVTYIYDRFGRVRNMTVTISGLGSKTMRYEYDVAGKHTKVSYQDAQSDAFYTWYTYDAQGRLAEVKTNTANNVGTATREAAYTYWPTGSVKQQLLGPDPTGTPIAVQAVDYGYNIRGSPLSINDFSNNLVDGNSKGGDAFAMELGYDDVATSIAGMSGVDKEARYNGNVSWLTWKTKDNNFASDKAGYVFKYDQHDRLSKADFGVKYSSWTNQARYDVGVNQTNGIEYYNNGNIHKLHRINESNVGSLATYDYGKDTDTNRLMSISGGSFSGSFTYDHNGNILTGNGITGSTYDYRNLPVSLTTSAGTSTHRYDADGNRIQNNAGKGSYYVRGAGGEVIAVYNGMGTLLYYNILAGGRVIGKMIR